MEIEYLSCEENTGLALADNEAVSSGGKDDATGGDSKKESIGDLPCSGGKIRVYPKRVGNRRRIQAKPNINEHTKRVSDRSSQKHKDVTHGSS